MGVHAPQPGQQCMWFAFGIGAKAALVAEVEFHDVPFLRIASGLESGIKNVAKTLAQQVIAKHRQKDCQARKQ